MTLPNLIIAGAPKCGTTSLFAWLSHHPQVCAASRKEVRWFMDEGYVLTPRDGDYRSQGVGGYEKFFSHCSSDARVVVDATPDYIYQQTALEIIPTLPSRPKVVFILRRPADRVRSVYRFAKNNMAVLPSDLSFKEYVRRMLETPEFFGHRVVVRESIAQSRYVEYLEQWYEVLGRDRIEVILFEQLQADPHGVMKRLSALTGIDANFWDSYGFPRENESFEVRFQMLQKFARRLQKGVARNAFTRMLERTYRKFNSRGSKESPGEEREVLAFLDEYFARDYERLQKLTGLDFARWVLSRGK